MNLQALDITAPDGQPPEQALARTTHMALAAHPDDIEIIGHHGIARCYDSDSQWFTGVVITDGAGSPRTDRYADYSDEQMVQVRHAEQISAARLGQYSCVAQLGYRSAEINSGLNPMLVSALVTLLRQAQPHTLYLHNFADRHQTHVSCCAHAIAALRQLPASEQPQQVYGLEVWRDLDWLPAAFKKTLDVSAQPHLRQELLQAFDSQVGGGKRYDLAVVARSSAHATFSDSHNVDDSTSVNYAIDLLPLLHDPQLTLKAYWQTILQAFNDEVTAQLALFP